MTSLGLEGDAEVDRPVSSLLWGPRWMCQEKAREREWRD